MTEQEQVTLVCSEPGCDFTVTANATGKSSATFKLGSHRANRHGYRKGKTPRARAAQQGAEDGERPIPVQVLAGMAEEFTPGKTSPPTQDEMTRALARGLYTISYATAATMVETDPTLREARDEVKDHWTRYLSFSQQASRDVSAPIAKAVTGSKINQKAGRAIVDNIDVASSVAAVIIMGVHWRIYLDLRKHAGGATPNYPAPARAPAPQQQPVTVPAGAPAPSSGVVLSYEDIERMKSNGAS